MTLERGFIKTDLATKRQRREETPDGDLSNIIIDIGE